MSLSDAKARLSEVVRGVRANGEEAVITVDGEPVVRIVRVDPLPRTLTPAEAAAYRALFAAVLRIDRLESEFDAVELVRDGRR